MPVQDKEDIAFIGNHIQIASVGNSILQRITRKYLIGFEEQTVCKCLAGIVNHPDTTGNMVIEIALIEH